MSDERSVEARLLSILALNFTNLVGSSTDSSYWSNASEVVVPEHITASLQTTAEFPASTEVRRLAMLGMSISKRTGDGRFDSLAREICMSVYDAIVGPCPPAGILSLIRLLEDIEECSRHSHYPSDQVQGYQRRLEFILGGSEDSNANSTSFQARDANSSTRRLTQHPPSSSPTTSYPSSFRESVESNASSVVDQMYLFLIFIYHILLLRLPTTYASLALDALCLEDDETCDANVWETFTDILLKQWKTIGLLSTLIFGATLTMFQIPSITSSSGLFVIVHCALLCVMMSLIYTSFLSVNFGSWRSSSTAERWVKEMRTASPHSLWNFWVLISLPAAWTCWGIFLFLTSMVLFAWPLSQHDSSQDSLDGVQESLGIRIFVMMVLFAGGVQLGCTICIA
ncbi:hypothetical protein DFH09DRAFT_1182825 [Mycena vulgaris]|nr:hypothetical protein DFH09DRAFT_1182825 [Mycena vulgaris]